VQHRNGMVIGALGALGGRQKYAVRLYDEFAEVARVDDWLAAIDWRAQWSASHLFWGGMHCYSLSRRCTEAWRAAVFAWLDANLDPATGWWRRGVAHADANQPLGGAAHIWPIYQHHGRAFPYPRRVIDSILALQKPDGAWIRFPNYLDLDALYGLAYMQTQAPAYRRADIARAVRRAGDLATRRFDAVMEQGPDLHTLLAAVGTLGLLQQLDRERFPDTVRWTDIFSDRRLYRVSAVEVLPATVKAEAEPD
jgi:hypothetical protein